jgi:putative hydrolase of the HAD superfamily
MTKIKYVFFDAVNTLMHKPELWKAFQKALFSSNIKIDVNKLQYHHKLLREAITFPDRTSKSFYNNFNSELLRSLGIIPEQKLLDDIFSHCSYLPWEKYSDTQSLVDIKVPIGILSNFNQSLSSIINNLFPNIQFEKIIISEDIGFQKPTSGLFALIVKETNCKPEEILYVGDSIKLDIEPAQNIGFSSILIDRDNYYPQFANHISSLTEIRKFL